MTLPIDLALLETAAAAAVGGVLGLEWAGARARRAPAGSATRGERTFLLVWIPPALARLATMLPQADPRVFPELALPLAAPATVALSVLLVLAPLAYRATRDLPAPRRKAFGATGLVAAASIAVAGVVASPFDSSRLADALADHASRCAAVARSSTSLPPEKTRPLEELVQQERKESALDAGRIHELRGLSPALARLEERRQTFAERARSLAASAEARALDGARAGAGRASGPPVPAKAAAGAPGRAGCAAVETGMSAREVERLLGHPDQLVSAEDVRGPRAERWAYARLLCRIHLVDGVVEFVD